MPNVRVTKVGEKVDEVGVPLMFSEAANGLDSAADGIVDEVRGAVSLADPEVGIVTDQAVIAALYPNIVPICTESFMEVSKEHYTLPWMVREIVQNFVDGNEANPQSLDGVEVGHSVEEGMHSFSFRGNWPFKNAKGLYSLHSGKVNTDRKKAGGNGIGLKQTALRMMRDFGVEKFDITGEGWCVSYKLVKKEALNADVGSRRSEFGDFEFDSDWLVAKVEKSENTGSCSYEIETKDEALASALGDFNNLGVKSDNDYLKNADYDSAEGAIKWLDVSEADLSDSNERPKLSRGRLYLNGQVMNFRDRGDDVDHWRGPDLVNLRLDNVSYDMSIDRPPVTSEDLSGYVRGMVEKMSKGDLVLQLKKTEKIWTTIKDEAYAWDKPACFVLIEAMVRMLKRHRYYVVDFEDDFGDKYLYLDTELSSKAKKKLIEKGYKICPDYFKDFGLEAVSSKIDAMESVEDQSPKRADLSWQAKDKGIELGYADYPKLKGVKAFTREMLMVLGEDFAGIDVVNEGDRKIRIKLNETFDEELLYDQMITPPDGEKARQLHALRGLIYWALSKGVLEKVVLANGEELVIFSLDETGKLLTKVVDSKSPESLHMKVRESDFENVVRYLKAGKPVTAKEIVDDVADSVGKRLSGIKLPSIPRPSLPEFSLPSFQVARFAKVLVVVMGLWGASWAANNLGYIAQNLTFFMAMGAATPDRNSPNETAEFNRWLSEGGGGSSENRSFGSRDLNDLYNEWSSSNVKGFSIPHAAPYAEHDDDPPIEDFKILDEPSQSQVSKMVLLKEYCELKTDVRVENKLFVYNGRGALGVNVGRRAIGLHEEVLVVSFDEALATFIHEIAHNQFSGHAVPTFVRANTLLHQAIQNSLLKIAQKLDDGVDLDEKERRILEIEEEWDMI
jgi:hypothetical protein